MPVELLVPVAIFVLGVIVAVSVSTMGIERIADSDAK